MTLLQPAGMEAPDGGGRAGQSIIRQVQRLRARIAACCAGQGRDPGTVRLIAVTKGQGPEVIPALIQAGIRDLGENRWEHQTVMRAAAPPEVRFHAIGRLQSRQLGQVLALSHSIHSLASAEHARRLSAACQAQGRRVEVFLQVNAGNDPAKAGVEPDLLPDLIGAVRAAEGLDLVGLMAMAPYPEAAEARRVAAERTFACLCELAAAHRLPRLSMGMSEDLEIALAHGATDLRIGRALFEPLP